MLIKKQNIENRKDQISDPDTAEPKLIKRDASPMSREIIEYPLRPAINKLIETQCNDITDEQWQSL